jgi:hypothetical protein
MIVAGVRNDRSIIPVMKELMSALGHVAGEGVEDFGLPAQGWQKSPHSSV